MLSKESRLNSNEFETIYETGRSTSGRLGYIKFGRIDNGPKVACTVPNQTDLTSVDRTRIRRRGYAVVADHFEKIPGNCGVIWFLEPEGLNISYPQLSDVFASFVADIQ